MAEAYIGYDVKLGGLTRHLDEPIPLSNDDSFFLQRLREMKRGVYNARNGVFDVFVDKTIVTLRPQASTNPALLSVTRMYRLPLSVIPGLEAAVVLFSDEHPLTLKVDGKDYSFIPPKTAQRKRA